MLLNKQQNKMEKHKILIIAFIIIILNIINLNAKDILSEYISDNYWYRNPNEYIIINDTNYFILDSVIEYKDEFPDIIIANSNFDSIPIKSNNLKKIQGIQILNHNIDKLPKFLEFLSRNCSIKVITLAYMNFKILPKEVAFFNQLDFIDLQHINEFKICFSLPKTLTLFRTIESNLLSFPDDIQNCTLLKEIALVNSIKKLPVNIERITKLEKFGMSFNGLLDANLFDFNSFCKLKDLQSLKDLYISGVDFRNSGIPDCIFKLVTLETLYLNYCKISNINKNILYLKNLKDLRIDYSELNEFPMILLDLENLEFFSVVKNKIENFEYTGTCKPTKLRKINLNYNSLTNKAKENIKKYFQGIEVAF